MYKIAAGLGVVALGVFAWVFRHMEGPDRSKLPPRIRDIVQMIDPQPEHPVQIPTVMGRICPVQPPPPPPVPDPEK
jgi:hypothetical protein